MRACNSRMSYGLVTQSSAPCSNPDSICVVCPCSASKMNGILANRSVERTNCKNANPSICWIAYVQIMSEGAICINCVIASKALEHAIVSYPTSCKESTTSLRVFGSSSTKRMMYFFAPSYAFNIKHAGAKATAVYKYSNDPHFFVAKAQMKSTYTRVHIQTEMPSRIVKKPKDDYTSMQRDKADRACQWFAKKHRHEE